MPGSCGEVGAEANWGGFMGSGRRVAGGGDEGRVGAANRGAAGRWASAPPGFVVVGLGVAGVD